MNELSAKKSIDTLISKARVHLYKPIQIAEILYRDRTESDVDLSSLETYRNASKRWRDAICTQFLGRTSTSSARYQDDLFNENAIPPNVLAVLGEYNREKNGAVEAYIYSCFKARISQMSTALDYVADATPADFELQDFLNHFWHEPGLRRSIDKVYEIVVYSLFSALVDALGVEIEVSMDQSKEPLLKYFEDFSELVLSITSDHMTYKTRARIHRVGVTNAADRGLDMFANFGLAIQIKHLSLTEELAEGIVSSVTADRIVIVCKDSERNVIVSLLNQIGWRARVQSVVTEGMLIDWYDRALRGRYASELGKAILTNVSNEIQLEFPSSESTEFNKFFKSRNYHKLRDEVWC